MYIRDFESYKAKRNLPILINLIFSFLIFSFSLAILFSIVSPIKIDENIGEIKKDDIYFIQTNLFFINFHIEKGDLVIVNSKKIKTENIFISQFVNLLTLNLLNRNQKYNVYKVIGTAYDIINIKDGILYVNGHEEINTSSTQLNKDQTFYLAKNQYYCVSTNKISLDDSLLFGIIDEELILGKIIKSFHINFNK